MQGKSGSGAEEDQEESREATAWHTRTSSILLAGSLQRTALRRSLHESDTGKPSGNSRGPEPAGSLVARAPPQPSPWGGRPKRKWKSVAPSDHISAALPLYGSPVAHSGARNSTCVQSEAALSGTGGVTTNPSLDGD